ncbi:MAG: hypothetical protein AUJ99_04215 [Caldisericum sp. CG2_30_36_11]|nr:MAG: hypothetical protein AUJ99_04215 [Caldisericum sp. CG2_30_36_11]
MLGNINLDLALYSDEFPKKGETIFGKDFFMNPGGKGANQAVAAKKVEGDMTLIGRVGKDYFGEIVLKKVFSHIQMPSPNCVIAEPVIEIICPIDIIEKPLNPLGLFIFLHSL